MTRLDIIAAALAAALLSWLPGAPHAEAIDVFAGAGPGAADATNVVVVIDNSANWNRPLGGSTRAAIVKRALGDAIGALGEAGGAVNIGLMLFNEAGGTDAGGGNPTGAHDGAYVRFALRAMGTAANRDELVAAIDRLDPAADAGAAAQGTLALEEARRYLGGLAILNGANTAAKLDRRALDGAGSRYAVAAAADVCRPDAVIYVGSGSPAGGEAAALPFVRALNDGVTPPQLALPPPYPAPSLPASQDAAPDWMDEYAGLLRRAAGASGAGRPVVVHTIALHDPGDNFDNASAATSGRALLLNAAREGGGRYVDATDAASLRQAFDSLLAGTREPDSAFVPAALPAAIQPTGTYLNQVYMGMFRPDAAGRPRWPGNMKQYRFAYDSATGALRLVDALDQPALEATTGAIASTAQSFWSTAETTGPVPPAGFATVDFFANAPSGAGLSPAQQRQEAPDGEVAEKGGVAQQLRAAYLGDQSARNVYTCPAAGCIRGIALRGSPVHAFDQSRLKCATHRDAFGLDAATCADLLPLLVDWVRGADNAAPGNEAAPGPGGLGDSPVRASVHGDVQHSRPLLVNYGAAGIVAFYGANDGTLRAVQAGQPAGGGGSELWAFVAPETFSRFRRLRDGSPSLQLPSPSSGRTPAVTPRADAKPKDYFFDGPVTHYEVRDAAGNITRAYLFAGARRGGAFLYAFDITVPAAPAFLWKHAARDGSDAAFDDLALTFSAARAATVAGYPRPVVIFGGGYHGGYDADGFPVGADADPPAPCVRTSAQGCGDRIFVLDAATGAVVATFQSNAGNGGDLAHGVAADVALVDAGGAGVIDRGYAADTGGNVWRIDFDARGPAQWKVVKLATVGEPSNPRKFLFAPDVVVTKGHVAVLVGSGDREKPLKATGSDRFYLFKDRATGADVAAAARDAWPIRGDDTTDGNMADVLNLDADTLREVLAGERNSGWFYTLEPGEKVVNAPLTAGGTVYFGTHRPVAPAAGSCRAAPGTARAYGLSFNTGTAARDLNGDGVRDAGDAAVVLLGGGLPPSPVAGIVSVVDAATGRSVFVPFVIGTGGTTGGAAGVPAQAAPATIDLKLSRARKKTWWYSRGGP